MQILEDKPCQIKEVVFKHSTDIHAKQVQHSFFLLYYITQPATRER